MESLLRPIVISTFLGLATSSYFCWGNLALSHIGPMHLVAPPNASRMHITPLQAVKFWEVNYDRGAVLLAPSALIGGLAWGATSYLSPAESLARKLFTASTVAYLSILPFTLIFLMPTNKALKAIIQRVNARSVDDNQTPALDAEESASAGQLLDRWRNLHAVRTTTGLLGWLSAVVVLLGSLPQ